MANQKILKKRISSVKNIGKITKALEMVSASKVQKAQERAVSAKPYAELVYSLTQNLSSEAADQLDIPLLRQPESTLTTLYVIVSTNRGLIGSLNANLLRGLDKKIKETETQALQFITVGKKGRNFALKNGELVADFSDETESADASALMASIAEQFTQGKADKVIFAYNNFVSALLQEPTYKQLLPIGVDTAQAKAERSLYNFEPDAQTLLGEILPFYFEVQIRDILAQAAASEHSARMMAMKNASDNAQSLQYNLSLYYNKVRQQTITNEINEIATASLALQ